jgi:hypothetical protein
LGRSTHIVRNDKRAPTTPLQLHIGLNRALNGPIGALVFDISRRCYMGPRVIIRLSSEDVNWEQLGLKRNVPQCYHRYQTHWERERVGCSSVNCKQAHSLRHDRDPMETIRITMNYANSGYVYVDVCTCVCLCGWCCVQQTFKCMQTEPCKKTEISQTREHRKL